MLAAIAWLVTRWVVIPVRLALFAEMFKEMPWSLSTLREVGGTEGVGVAFLEEAVALREAGITLPILVMGGIFGDQIPVFLRHGLTLTASSIDKLRQIDETARYTVKRYTSRKSYSGEDEWKHEQIRLEPLNPAFEAWDVEPDGFAVVAEWLRVIE